MKGWNVYIASLKSSSVEEDGIHGEWVIGGDSISMATNSTATAAAALTLQVGRCRVCWCASQFPIVLPRFSGDPLTGGDQLTEMLVVQGNEQLHARDRNGQLPFIGVYWGTYTYSNTCMYMLRLNYYRLCTEIGNVIFPNTPDTCMYMLRLNHYAQRLEMWYSQMLLQFLKDSSPVV